MASPWRWCEVIEDVQREIRSRLDSPSLAMLRETCRSENEVIEAPSAYNVTLHSVQKGYLFIVKLLADRFPHRYMSNHMLAEAARAAQAEVFRYLWGIQASEDCIITTEITELAARGGSLEILQLCHQHAPLSPWDAHLVAPHGDLELIQFLFDQGIDIYEQLAYAVARHGHLEVLHFLSNHGCPVRTAGVLDAAAEGGHLHIVETFVDESLFSAFTLECATCSGNLALVRFVHAVVPTIPEKIIEHAVISGSLEVVRYLAEFTPLPLTETLFCTACETGNLGLVRYLVEAGAPGLNAGIAAAALCGHLHIVRYFESIGTPWEAWISAAAVRSCRLDCMAFAVDRGCPLDASVFDNAVQADDLSLVRYLVDGIKSKNPSFGALCEQFDVLLCNTQYCHTAIRSRNLSLLRYLRGEGFQWNSSHVKNLAAYSGSYRIFKYILNEVGIQSDAEPHSVSIIIVRYGYLQLIKYVLDAGFDSSDSIANAAIAFRHTEIMRWLLSTDLLLTTAMRKELSEFLHPSTTPSSKTGWSDYFYQPVSYCTAPSPLEFAPNL